MSKRAIVPLIVLAVAVCLFVAINGRWTSPFNRRAEEKTEDAYVTANMTPLSTRISGTVRKMEVEDYQSVKAGQVLVEIDDDEYRAILEQAKAALAASEAALGDNQEAKSIQEAKIQNAEAMVGQAEAAVAAARASGLHAAGSRAERT
jgi:membrane fusion protein (multidrug efflux system)